MKVIDYESPRTGTVLFKCQHQGVWRLYVVWHNGLASWIKQKTVEIV